MNGIQKDHAKNEREKNQAKAEVERLNRIAGTSSTNSDSGPSSFQIGPKATKAASTSLSAADQKRQWAQLADMGIAIPENSGPDNAAPGGWQTVSQKVVDEPAQNTDDKLNIGVRKRKLENQDDDEEAGETVVKRGWGSTTRTYPGSTPMHNDLDSLLAASVFKKKESLKLSSEEDTKHTISSLAESNGAVDDIKNGRDTKPIPVGNTSSEISPSVTLEPLNQEDSSLGLHSSEMGIATPVFKKRRPKK